MSSTRYYIKYIIFKNLKRYNFSKLYKKALDIIINHNFEHGTYQGIINHKTLYKGFNKVDLVFRCSELTFGNVMYVEKKDLSEKDKNLRKYDILYHILDFNYHHD